MNYKFIGLWVSLLLQFSACHNHNSWYSTKQAEYKSYTRLLNIANSYKISHPDSTLVFIDSALTFAYQTELSDTSLLPALFIKSDAFMNLGLTDSVTPLLLRSRFIALKAADSSLIAESGLRLGLFLRNLDQSTLAERYALEALNLFELLDDKNNIGNACDLYGNLQSDLGNFIKAHEYLLRAYDIFDQLGDIKALGIESTNIGANFKLMGNIDEAIRYSRIACEKLEQVRDTTSLLVAYNNLGIALRTSHPDSALYYYHKSLELNKNTSPFNTIITRFNIANLYLDKEDFSMAFREFSTVLDLCRQHHLIGGIARVYHAFGKLYVLQEEYQKADFYLLRSIKLADSLGHQSLVPEFNKTLLQSYKEQGKTTEYTQLSEAITAQRDSTINKDKQAAIAYLAQYQKAEKKEQENVYLNTVLEKKENILRISGIIIAVVVLALVLLGLLLKRNTMLSKEHRKEYNKLIALYRDECTRREHQAEIILSNDETPEADTQALENQRIIKQLLHYYKTEKPYLNPRLRVEDVAETLKTSRKTIASALNQYDDSNFVLFTNTYRVKQAIMLMESDEYQNYKMTAIAADAGFGSAQSFYRAFQQITGVRPNHYRKNILNP